MSIGSLAQITTTHLCYCSDVARKMKDNDVTVSSLGYMYAQNNRPIYQQDTSMSFF